MTPSLRSHHPALPVSALFLVILFAMVAATRHLTHGLFVYPLDDSYIHLALARTLAATGTWGLRPGEFASASSSPGWTLLLAASDLLFGSHLLTPILLNALLGVALLFAVDHGLRLLRPSASLPLRYLALVAVLFASPITNLAFLGMEHVAQTLCVVLLVTGGSALLSLPPSAPIPASRLSALLLTSAAAGAIRYESVFVILPLTLLFLLRRRPLAALLIATSSALAPALFGLYSHHLSGLWLPFSVLMKSSLNQPHGSLLHRAVELTAGGTFRPVLLLPLLLWILRSPSPSPSLNPGPSPSSNPAPNPGRSPWSPSQIALLLSSAITALHLALAPTRWLMRYEAYFVALFLLVTVAALPHLSSLADLRSRLLHLSTPGKALAAVVALLSLALSPFLAYRVVVGLVRGPMASVDRFHEHIQMARFVQQFYNHDTVVANDIGAVSYYSSARLLDPVGLASDLPVRDLRSGHPLTAAGLAAWASSQNAPIAVIQPTWNYMHNLVPAAWIPVGTWKLPRNIVFADLVVGFYATDPAAVPRLCSSLGHFELPAAVDLELTPGVCTAPAYP